MNQLCIIYDVEQLSTHISRVDTVMRESLSVDKKVAITLWCLATPAEYRTIAHVFGVARCTVCCIVHETCSAIVAQLLNVHIKFPHETN